MKTKPLVLYFTFFLISLSNSIAIAGTFEITPLRISLSNDGSAESFRITNLEDRATTVQIVVRPWHDRNSSAEVVNSVFAVPPIFDLPASGEQTVRLVARGMDDVSVENAYVMSVKEVADETNIEGTGLALALEMQLPVFVTPPDVTPEPQWSIRKMIGEKPAIVLSNSGTAHLYVESFELSRAEGAEPIIEVSQGRHALAGEKVDWPLDLEELKGPVVLQARTNIGLIEELISPSNP